MSIVRTLIGLALLLPLAACASELEGDSSSAPCELNPELAVQPRALTGNGIQANGIQNNRVIVNGIDTNRIALNSVGGQGTHLNGFVLNGRDLQGNDINGIAIGAAMNELVGLAPDGRVLSGEAFVGTTLPAVFSDGSTIDLVIASFERSSTESDIALYELTYKGQSICASGTKGMFMPGIWDERGARHDSLTTGGHTTSVSFSCLTGVIAKCARWGYAPWRVGSALHQTCTRMARADYCGTGVSYTRDGTTIDMFDVKSIQEPTNDATLLFEAGWNEHGATCVSRPRYDAIVATSGEAILPSCWRDLPTCSSFEEAKTKGATIGNASRPQTRRICQ